MKIKNILVNAVAMLATVLAANETIFSSGVGNPILAWAIVSLVGALVGALAGALIERVELLPTFVRISEEAKKNNEKKENDNTVANQ